MRRHRPEAIVSAPRKGASMIELLNSFTVPASLDDAWRVLLDIERIAPCMPGAKLESADPATGAFGGSVRVKLGPMVMTYRGTVRIVDTDRQAYRAELEAEGNDARGGGSAKASVVISLAPPKNADPHAAETEVSVQTSLHVTGKPAQFGRSVMADVSERLIAQFAERLRAELSTPSGTQSAADALPISSGPIAQPSTSVARPVANEPIDLLAMAGGVADKRVVVGVVAATLLAITWLLSRGSSRRRPDPTTARIILLVCPQAADLLSLRQDARDQN